MESVANPQVDRYAVRLENARLQRGRLQRRDEEDRGERRIPSAQIMPIPAACALCGDPVEVWTGSLDVVDKRTGGPHVCRVRRVS